MAGQLAAAQTAAVVTLSCDGTTMQIVGGKTWDTLPAKESLVVNLAEHTVTGFGVVANIGAVDDVSVSFSGEGAPLGETSSVPSRASSTV